MEIKNKKAYFDYFIEDSIECGIELKGTEIKSLRKGSGDLKDTFAVVKNGEVFLLNMYEERRTRKLLLHKKEIKKLREALERDGYSLVPLKAYLVNNRVKILLGLGKGKKLYDKRETIKERDLRRESMQLRQK